MTLRLICHCLLGIVLCSDLPAQNGVRPQSLQATRDKTGVTESEQVESYLRKLGLHHRVVDLLERQLATETDATRQQQLARKLAEQYTERILADSDLQFDWHFRGERLLRLQATRDEFPNLEIAVLQAKYRSQIRDFEAAWIEGQQQQFSLNELKGLIEQLDRFRKRTREQIDVLSQAQQVDDADKVRLDRQQSQLEYASLQADYLLGWASYFAGILDVSARQTSLNRSENSFREFHQIDRDKPVLELQSRWFDLESGWNSLALIGWAMCLEAQGKNEQARHLFQISTSVRQSLDESTIWILRLKSKIYCGKYAEAEALCEKLLAQDSLEPTARFPVYVALFQLASGIADANEPTRLNLQRAALIGLTRGSQRKAIEQLLGESGQTLADSGFVNRWILGFLAAFEAGEDPAKLRNAKSLLASAVESATRSDSDSDVARCRFLIGQIDLRLQEFSAAAEQFNWVLQTVENDPVLTPETMWYLSQALSRMSSADSQYAQQASLVLEQLVQRFPDSRWASRVEFENLRLESQSLPPKEALRRFQKIGADNRDYPAALFEMVRLRFRIWQQAHRRPDHSAEREWQEFLQAEFEYRRLESPSTARKIQTLLMVVDAHLQIQPKDSNRVALLMSEASKLANELEDQSRALAELRYYQFRIAQTEDEATAIHWALWILENARESRFEQSALVYVANIIQRPDLSIELKNRLPSNVDIYQRLTTLLGQELPDLRGSQNARIASFQLAKALAADGKFADAQAIFEKLVGVVPNQTEYLVGLADAKMGQNDLEGAMPIWSRVSRGSTAGTDSWYASKLGLIQCLISTDLSKAEQLYRQTCRLSPEIPPAWQSQFAAVEKTLSETAEENGSSEGSGN